MSFEGLSESDILIATIYKEMSRVQGKYDLKKLPKNDEIHSYMQFLRDSCVKIHYARIAICQRHWRLSRNLNKEMK